MKLIKGSDLLAAFGALHELKEITRSLAPETRASVAAAIRDTFAANAPVGATAVDCMNDHALMVALADAAIRAFNASGMETRQGGDSEAAPSRSDDSPTAEGGDAHPDPL